MTDDAREMVVRLLMLRVPEGAVVHEHVDDDPVLAALLEEHGFMEPYCNGPLVMVVHDDR